MRFGSGRAGDGCDPDATSGALLGRRAACPPGRCFLILARHLDSSSQPAGKAAGTREMLPLFLRGVLAKSGCNAFLFPPRQPCPSWGEQGAVRTLGQPGPAPRARSLGP